MIGRAQFCRVRIRDESLSKCHAVLTFSAVSGWILTDGDANKGASTNGTWLYSNEEFEVYENMFFKSGQNVFQASLSK
jgi:hypothetical protein